MYIDSIKLNNFRVFKKSEAIFTHSDRVFSSKNFPKPILPNINLLLGDNGSGKTTLLKAIALSALGPAVGDSGIYPYRLIRNEPEAHEQPQESTIESTFITHAQDEAVSRNMVSKIAVLRKGDLESLRWTHIDEEIWHPIFSSSSDAFFFVGYGATRRVEKREQFSLGSRKASSFIRAQRIQSLFEESYSLIPLNAWLPEFRHSNLERYKQAVNLINNLMGKGHYNFIGEIENGEYIFDRKGLKVPFPALSDGYRAFLGWIGDLLYHICDTCPEGKSLTDNKGIVMVDEIDLHLHPKWQMSILHTLGKSLPNIQFILTSHSPLIVGSLEWMNIIVMLPKQKQSAQAKRIRQAVHGLDADQVLLTSFFGLESTRAFGKTNILKELALKTRDGDTDAAIQLMDQISHGMEDKE